MAGKELQKGMKIHIKCYILIMTAYGGRHSKTMNDVII